MNSTDPFQGYTAPRALLVGLLFLAAVAFRIPAVVLAVATHLADRATDRLVSWIHQIPPAPIRHTATTRRRYAR